MDAATLIGIDRAGFWFWFWFWFWFSEALSPSPSLLLIGTVVSYVETEVAAVLTQLALWDNSLSLSLLLLPVKSVWQSILILD